VHLPAQSDAAPPTNLFQVVNRCFQIMQTHAEQGWRQESDLVIVPDVRNMAWDAFGCGPDLIKAGEIAALEALPTIYSWFPDPAALTAPPHPQSATPDSIPA
jgi:hypothetical protein